MQQKRLYFDWKHLAPVAGVAQASFTVQRKIPVAFRVEVDYQHSKLKVSIKNHENLESFSKSFTPTELDNKFVDSLLRYFLRKDKAFITEEDLSEASKEVIKASVRSAIISQKQQEKFIRSKETESEETEKKGPLKALLDKFRKS